jgi:hypothetical protein
MIKEVLHTMRLRSNRSRQSVTRLLVTMGTASRISDAGVGGVATNPTPKGETGPGISHRASQIDSLGGSGWIEERIERSIDQIEKWLHLHIFDFELLY